MIPAVHKEYKFSDTCHASLSLGGEDWSLASRGCAEYTTGSEGGKGPWLPWPQGPFLRRVSGMFVARQEKALRASR